MSSEGIMPAWTSEITVVKSSWIVAVGSVRVAAGEGIATVAASTKAPSVTVVWSQGHWHCGAYCSIRTVVTSICARKEDPASTGDTVMIMMAEWRRHADFIDASSSSRLLGGAQHSLYTGTVVRSMIICIQTVHTTKSLRCTVVQ